MKWSGIICIYFAFVVGINAAPPDCLRWPTNMAFVHLKNAGITNNQKIDFDKTKTDILATELIGENLFRQIHYITFA